MSTGLRFSRRGAELTKVATSHDEAIVTERSTAWLLFRGVFESDRGRRRRRRKVVEFRKDGDGGRRILGFINNFRRGKLLERSRTGGRDGRLGRDRRRTRTLCTHRTC